MTKRHDRFSPDMELYTEEITEDEYRKAGLNILDHLPDQDETQLATQYIQILQTLGFDE